MKCLQNNVLVQDKCRHTIYRHIHIHCKPSIRWVHSFQSIFDRSSEVLIGLEMNPQEDRTGSFKEYYQLFRARFICFQKKSRVILITIGGHCKQRYTCDIEYDDQTSWHQCVTLTLLVTLKLH